MGLDSLSWLCGTVVSTEPTTQKEPTMKLSLDMELHTDSPKARHRASRAMRELAAALSNELADSTGGPITDPDGRTIGNWRLA